MSRDGSGNYTLPALNPVTTGTTISSTWANNTMNDIATALTASVAKDGQTAMTGNLPMGTYKLTGMGVGNAATDSITLGQSQAQAHVWAGTAGGTADALTLSPAPAITAYAAGQMFRFKSGASPNTAATTVAISGLTTKAIQNQGVALAGGEIEASKWYAIVYDGAAFQLLAMQPAMTTDATPIVNGSSDASKKVRLEVDGLTTATTRVMTVPDYDLRIGNMPAGVIMDYAGASVPTGWLECDGSAVSRTTYAALFAAISTTWNTGGEAGTDFRLPDFRGRTRIGKGTGSGLTARTLAATGGAETHALSEAELATHTHVQNAHGHTGSTIKVQTSGGGAIASLAAGTTTAASSLTSDVSCLTISNATAVNQNTGSGTAHNNMQPFAVTMTIISI